MPAGRPWEYMRQQTRQQAAGAPPQRYVPERLQRQRAPSQSAGGPSAGAQLAGGLTAGLGGILTAFGAPYVGAPLMAVGSTIPAIDAARRSGSMEDVGRATGSAGQVLGAVGREFHPPQTQQPTQPAVQQPPQRPPTPGALPGVPDVNLAGRGIGGAGAANVYGGAPSGGNQPWWLRTSRSRAGGWRTQ